MWITFLAVASGTDDASISIYPTGIVDNFVEEGLNTPEGWIFMAHPMLVRSKYITPYTPQIIKDFSADNLYSFENLLIGPKHANLVIPSFNNQVIYDAETNKPITEYQKGINKIFISADLYKERHLVYEDPEGITRLVQPLPRFPYTHADSATWAEEHKHITCPTYPTNTTLVARPNPAQQFEMYIPIRNNKHSWKLTYKKSVEIVNDKLIKLGGGVPRSSTVWDEEPKKITNKLFQLSEKGLQNWIHDQTWMTDEPYFLKTAGDKTIILNYDIEVADIDYENGRILFVNDAPSDIQISYCLNDEWENIPVEFNPLVKQTITNTQSTVYNVPDHVLLKIDPLDGNIYYEIDGNGQILKNGISINAEADVLNYERYETIARISLDYSNPELIDIRREGGMLIDKNKDLFDIDSHISWGFMGVNPSQVNVAIVRVPDSALETLIYQFHEEHIHYGEFGSPYNFPLNWDSMREYYINFIKDNPDDPDLPNIIREELLTYVKRHIPAGVRIAITDAQSNVLYYDYDSSISYGGYL